MPKLTQEEEISGSGVGKDKELGHHKRIKKTETSLGTRDHMTGGTEKIIQKIGCTETLLEVTETRKMDSKQREFSKNSQHSWPAAVARAGYAQTVVNSMQLEDEAFIASHN